MTTDVISKPIEKVGSVAVRFAGDSGDGMQVAGSQFTISSVLAGNDVATMPDYPAEIRAPAGSLAGVSGFQIHFASEDIHTPGDRVQALVAMNPAALKVNLLDLEEGGILIINEEAFTPANLKLAGYASSPLTDGSLSRYQVYATPMRSLTRRAVEEVGLSNKETDRCKNFFALGLLYWLYDRPIEPTLRWIAQKFAGNADLLQANELALRAGYAYGENSELFPVHYRVEQARLEPGIYRTVRGNEALALGMITAAHLAGKTLVYASYPITPASDILHELARQKGFDVLTFQAEDEIAAICSAIGAAYGGAFAATGTSGPGMALKSEGIGLAVMLELPLVVINAQRGGPSTGLPTKTEQADLFQAVMGRNGECPVPVLAPQSPGDCFDTVIEAFRIAVRFMTPVIVLSDGYIGMSAEPWRVPRVEDLEPIVVMHPEDPEGFLPYRRNADLSRPWALPGTPRLAHRIGSLEKEVETGNVSYDPINHQEMCELRAQKVANVANTIPEQSVFGDLQGDLLVVSWGGTFGAVRTAVDRARTMGRDVSHVHLRHLNPMPRNLGTILSGFTRVLVPELNLGQLLTLLRARYPIRAVGLNKIQGRPLTVSEVLRAIDVQLAGGEPR